MQETATVDAAKIALIKEALTRSIVTVEFTKRDGTVRVMNCTLMESVLPAHETVTETTLIKPDTQTVWDVDAGGWRTFRWDSTISFVVEP